MWWTPRHRIFFLGVLTLLGAAIAEESPVPMRDWKLIILHHSATVTGSADTFDTAHRARGMVNGLAYHFVICNGSDGQEDGAVQTGDRWVRQIPGGHCRQPEINESGIGICLVGDFTRDRPSPKQMDALVALVRRLQEQFHIAEDSVLGHGEIIGEYSECPGKEFPWNEFRKQLREKPLFHST